MAAVNPNTGNPNLLILGPDNYEQNDFRATAAFLGSASTINAPHESIFPNVLEHRFAPADQDYYRAVAQQTGTLDFQVYFRLFSTALLPAGGNLNIQVLDVAGNVIASGAPGQLRQRGHHRQRPDSHPCRFKDRLITCAYSAPMPTAPPTGSSSMVTI